ncbi:MAG: hypothetical protein ACOC0N_09280, partial [Chroococcales cyanobacterium]
MEEPESQHPNDDSARGERTDNLGNNMPVIPNIPLGIRLLQPQFLTPLGSNNMAGFNFSYFFPNGFPDENTIQPSLDNSFFSELKNSNVADDSISPPSQDFRSGIGEVRGRSLSIQAQQNSPNSAIIINRNSDQKDVNKFPLETQESLGRESRNAIVSSQKNNNIQRQNFSSKSLNEKDNSLDYQGDESINSTQMSLSSGEAIQRQTFSSNWPVSQENSIRPQPENLANPSGISPTNPELIQRETLSSNSSIENENFIDSQGDSSANQTEIPPSSGEIIQRQTFSSDVSDNQQNLIQSQSDNQGNPSGISPANPES